MSTNKPATASADTDNQKSHKSFRFTPKTSQQLKDLATLFGRSETSMMEQIIDTFFEKRLELFEEDRQKRLSQARG